MNKKESISLKKQWKKPELLIMLASVKGGNDPHVNEATASTGGGGNGQGHPGLRVSTPGFAFSAPDWTHAHS